MSEYLYFVKLIRKEFVCVALGMLMSFAASFASMMLMGTAAWLLSAMAIAGSLDIPLALFIPSAMLRLSALMRTLLRYAERYVTHDATFRLLSSLRVFLFEKALQLDYEASVRLKSADVQRRMQTDLERLELIPIRQVTPFVCAVAIGFVTGCILCFFSSAAALAAVLLLLFAGFVFPVFLTYMTADVFTRQNALSSDLNQKLSVMVHGFTDLVLAGQHGRYATEFLQESEKLSRCRAKTVFVEQTAHNVIAVCAEITLLSVLLLSADSVLQGKTTGPQLMMLGVASMAAFEVMVPLSAACLNMPYVMHSVKRVSELLHITDSEEELKYARLDELKRPVKDLKDVAVLHPEEEILTVCCKKLSFAYSAGTKYEKKVFSDLYAEFRSDRNYLLRAPSGRGKSTLTLLITAVLKAQGGEITLNGRSYEELSPEQIRSNFAVSLQDIALFSGTVRDVFRQVREDVSDEEIMEVLQLTELTDMIEGMPDGLNTFIGAAALSISGGQARRLCTARALIMKDRKFLLLDEPGEGLDEEQEERILERIQQRRRGVIIISHRRAGERYADEIISL